MTDSTLRRLVLMRHSKAEQEAAVDHERSLAERGHVDAAAAGRWLKEQGIAPELVLCSTAARTRETWAAAVEASGLGAITEHEPRIYNASVDTLIEVVREADVDARTVVLVGHAPGVPGLAITLSEGQGEEEPQQELAEGFPTSTIAVLEFDGAWADLAPGGAVLRAVHTARG